MKERVNDWGFGSEIPCKFCETELTSCPGSEYRCSNCGEYFLFEGDKLIAFSEMDKIGAITELDFLSDLEEEDKCKNTD